MEFRHELVDPEPPGESMVICLPVDLTGTGRDDVIIGAKGGDPNLFWYENRADGWRRHDMAMKAGLEAGGVVADVDGDGRPDVVAGQKWDGTEAYWFEHPPEDPRDRWTPHLITDEFQKYHDQAFADVDDDGDAEVVLLSQKPGVIMYYDVPGDPTVEPWPADNRHLVTEDAWDVEGVDVLDIDGDGDTEIVAGRNIFHRADDAAHPDGEPEGEGWIRERLAPGWTDERVRVQVADLDGDGRDEVVVSECELPYFGPRREIYHDARVAICTPPAWEADVIADGLFCPHSLQVGDFDGDGHLDIYVGESSLGEHEHPRQFVFENDGTGTFTRHLIDRGRPTHEAKVADLTGDGVPDIVGKDDAESGTVDAWYNETRSADLSG